MNTINFDDAIKVLPFNIRNTLMYIDLSVKKETYEIRLRKNCPLMLYGTYGSVFIKADSTHSFISYNGSLYITENDIKETVAAVCEYSFYSKQKEFINGYLAYGNGHRIGLSADYQINNTTLFSINNINSLCIRIAADKTVLPDTVSDLLDLPYKGIIISGKPCSGKTTLLRAIADKISSDCVKGYKKLVIIDERYEISLNNNLNCDVLRGCSKQSGIIHAIRTLSPDIIICDEISSCEEVDRISEGFYCGVKFMVTVHASSVDELFSGRISKKLIETSCFDTLIMLDNSYQAGDIKEIVKLEKVKC